MDRRLKLHEEFKVVLGSRNVYFQPPASVLMKYPCIRYSKKGNDARYANNGIYKTMDRYEGVVIDYDPDTTIPDRLLKHLPMCSLGSGYVADGLNHYPFTVYY